MTALCTNDEVRFTISRQGEQIIVEVDVKWFGYEEEFGADVFLNSITDRFQLPKNAIYKVNGTPFGGVIPESVTALCESPCGFTYACGGDIQPVYNFDPELDTEPTDPSKKRDIRTVSDRVGEAFPERTMTARILGIGSAYNGLPIYRTNLDGDIQEFEVDS